MEYYNIVCRPELLNHFLVGGISLDVSIHNERETIQPPRRGGTVPFIIFFV